MHFSANANLFTLLCFYCQQKHAYNYECHHDSHKWYRHITEDEHRNICTGDTARITWSKYSRRIEELLEIEIVVVTRYEESDDGECETGVYRGFVFLFPECYAENDSLRVECHTLIPAELTDGECVDIGVDETASHGTEDYEKTPEYPHSLVHQGEYPVTERLAHKK